MKIAFFHLAFLYSGGGEKLALKEIELLRQQGHTVDCFVPLIDYNECYPDIIKSYGINEIFKGFSQFFSNKPELGVIITCLLFPLISWRFRKYDVTFCANQPSAILGYIIKLFFRLPYIVYLAQPTRLIYPRPIDRMYGLKLKNKMTLVPHIINIFRPFFFWIDLKSIHSADKFLCNGYYMQEILEQVYGRTPTICSSGTDQIETANNLSNKLIVNEKTISSPYILVSNRHVPQKKIEIAIEIIRHLKTKYLVDIPLVISGVHTYYTEDLKMLVKNLNLENNVYFLGYVSEKNMEILYQQSFTYIYTAPEEDFGMGVIEAMSYGKPVLAWNKAGPSRIINSGVDGFLLNLNDTNACAKLLHQLLNDSNLYTKISQNALLTIKNNYLWDHHQQILTQSIEEIRSHEQSIYMQNVSVTSAIAD